MNNTIIALGEQVRSGYQLTEADALMLSNATGSDRLTLFVEATRIREHYFKKTVSLCSIINAKSGCCPENCCFCAQSSHNTAAPQMYPLVSADELVAGAEQAASQGASCFGIVTSGTTMESKDELSIVAEAVGRIDGISQLSPSCSLGIMGFDTLSMLKEAGMATYHHNLETSRSFFPMICSTHAYENDVATIRAAKEAGLRVCSGGIFGLGETFAQRIEMAVTLRELEVDSVPVNFLDPVPGTPLEQADYLTPLECLTIIAVYRFMLPDRHITVCGGRERNLRELQSWIFMAGASGMMTGNYLTKTGRNPEQDRRMIADLGLKIASDSFKEIPRNG